MLFSSLVFLWAFLPIVLLLYYALPAKAGNALLLFASLFFYAWGEPKYIILMLCSILMNYLFGLGLGKSAGAAKKAVLVASVVANLGLLGYFKYYDFAAQLVNAAAHAQLLPIQDIALPIGISFYTFQTMSYLIDLYRGKLQVQKSLPQLALYISFFPQLIAGPIVQYSLIEQQLSHRPRSWQGVAYGVKRFIYGLAKKVLLANAFAAAADEIFGLAPQALSTGVAWLGTGMYALQIYYDFSGYSDMAVGLGSMFGFTFPENFNYPYLAASVSDFWRRWHMTLSGWFREYLYIPLGGNRKGMVRTLLNLMIVFFCTGLWHGANLQFVFWGLFHGCFLVAERLLRGKLPQNKVLHALGHVYTLLVVLVGWLFFRAPGLHAGLVLLKSLFLPTAGSGAYTVTRFLTPRLVLLAVVGVALCGVVQAACKKLRAALFDAQKITVLQSAAQLALLFLCMMQLVSNTYNPFIYFRF